MSIENEKRMSVLVVDDDDACCSALKVLLGSEGFDVSIATSGEAALARILECPPDVLLSDLRMPGMDGITLLRAVQERAPLPVIMMSADGLAEDDVLDAGAFAYVCKPLDVDAVVRVIEKALASRG